MPTMSMSYREGLFVIRTFSREDGRAAKEAGAQWHGPHNDPRWPAAACAACATRLPLNDYWYFPKKNEARAIRLLAIADESARAQLEAAETKLEVSKSTGTQAPVGEGARELLSRDVPVPKGLSLFPYQKTGVLFLSEAKYGALLADSPGLGKTVQLLALINLERIRRSLIVVPASLRLNWTREAVRWLVDPTRIHVVTDSETTCANVDPGQHEITCGPRIAPSFWFWRQEQSIVIVNYDRVREPDLHALLMNAQWDLLAADEAHFLKNPRALRTISVLGKEERGKLVQEGLRHKSTRFIAMTGTPLPNKPVEMWPVLHAVAPETFKDFFPYARRYCDAHKRYVSPRVGEKWDFTGASNLEELQAVLRSTCMVRRLKEDVLLELPPKTRQIVALPYEDYEKWVRVEKDELEDAEKAFDEIEAELEIAGVESNAQAYEEAAARLGTVGKMSFKTMSKSRLGLALAKLPAVLEICDDRLEELDGGKIIVFAHHHKVIEKIAKHYGDEAVVVYGEVGTRERDESVTRFQTDPKIKVFIGSIAAAGVGLTLTAASTVIFAEVDWVPANIQQAEDRAHRIGQRDAVTVLHIVVERSLDARMVQMLVAKQEVADRALDRTVEAIAIPSGPEYEARQRLQQEAKEREARRWPLASPRLRQLVQEGMQRLVEMDMDRARDRNEMGFSRFDGVMGRRVAHAENPSQGLIWGIGVKLIQKYRRQLGVLADEVRDEADFLKKGHVP